MHRHPAGTSKKLWQMQHYQKLLTYFYNGSHWENIYRFCCNLFIINCIFAHSKGINHVTSFFRILSGGHTWRGACMSGRHAWQGACMAGEPCVGGGMHGGGMHGRGACVAGVCVWQEGMHGRGGRGCAWQGDMRGIWSMSGWYASYWNASLLLYYFGQTFLYFFQTLETICNIVVYGKPCQKLFWRICQNPLMSLHGDQSTYRSMNFYQMSFLKSNEI